MDYKRYIVRAGDTIYKISKAYNVQMAEIIQLNHLKHPDRIYSGQVLLLPVQESTEPALQIPEPALTYATLLYEAYAGKNSELTAITTYLYQAVLLDNPEFDGLFRPIAYEKMQHLEKLALSLRYLGVDPKYGELNNGNWIEWRANFVNYTSDLCSLLEGNIADEAGRHQKYLELAQIIPIPQIQCFLTEIAASAECHYNLFCQAKEQYCNVLAPCPPPLPCSPPPIYTPIESQKPVIEALKPMLDFPGPHEGGRG